MMFKKSRLTKQLRSALCIAGLCLVSMAAYQNVSAAEPDSAFENWIHLQENLLLNIAAEVIPEGSQQPVSYGAEKEGSSAIITKLFGPNAMLFRRIVSTLTPDNRVLFVRALLNEIKRGVAIKNQVQDVGGKIHRIDLRTFQRMDAASVSEATALQLVDHFLNLTGDHAFSYFSYNLRSRLYNCNFPGLRAALYECFRSIGLRGSAQTEYYDQWQPLLGEPQKYVSKLSGQVTQDGWEFHTRPTSSYTEFENTLAWLEATLQKKTEAFTAPGHQRIVVPYPTHLRDKHYQFANLIRMLQIYVVLEGLVGKTGIEASSDKRIHPDRTLMAYPLTTNRGVLRVETGRFGDSTAIEFRAGTKDPRVQRFIQQAAVAYMSTGDYGTIDPVTSWSFSYIPTETQAQSKFGLPPEVIRACFNNLKALKLGYGVRTDDRYKRDILFAPLWSWENLPFLSPIRKQILLKLSEEYIKKVAATPPTSRDSYRELLSDWARASQLAQIFKAELEPKSQLPLPKLEQLVPEAGKISMGFEYTAQFPKKVVSKFQKNSNGDRIWQEVSQDMSVEEKKAFLKLTAESLSKQLGGSDFTRASSGEGHGHGLGIQFRFWDPKRRPWRVEWDGITRNYDDAGLIQLDSVRGGHIEIVTPKFIPKDRELSAVYSVFKDLGVFPKENSGGGHINVDLAPFDKNPKALARFIALFWSYRGIISEMFQAPERFATAEPHAVTPQMYLRLLNFNGTAEELKKLLYDGGIFNSRRGRKTQYTQLDISAYFQDVIPDSYKGADFDIKNPKVPWRLNFDVNPKVRKLEFRLFNSPKSLQEAKLQIMLVRALLNHALRPKTNSTFGHLSEKDWFFYDQDPHRAFDELRNMTETLDLPYEHYSNILVQALSRNQLVLQKRSFKARVTSFAEKYPIIKYQTTGQQTEQNFDQPSRCSREFQAFGRMM